MLAIIIVVDAFLRHWAAWTDFRPDMTLGFTWSKSNSIYSSDLLGLK